MTSRLMRTASFAACVIAAAASSKVDFAHLGPAIGAAVPDFSAADQNGKTRSLKSLLERNGAVLVFFRSADW